MFISQVKVDTNNRRKLKELTHLGAYHNWVEQSFPEEWEKGTRSRKLWRLDSLRGEQVLLIVSGSKPDLERLEAYGIPGSARTKDYEPFLNALENGMSMRFRVKMNPATATKEPGASRGRVHPVNISEQLPFFLDRAAQYGFSVREEDVRIVNRGHEMQGKRHESPIALASVTYEGVLKVEQIERFREALTQGMGKKKAYGFGLMTVIPMESAL